MTKPFILEPKTGFKLMEHLEVQHGNQDDSPGTNVRELKALHQKLHNLYPDVNHTHRRR